jgi:hypothetical protein
MADAFLVEAAGVEPVPAHFLTIDGTRLPTIGLDPPRNLLPRPSPGVPWIPPPSWRHFGDGGGQVAVIGTRPARLEPSPRCGTCRLQDPLELQERAKRNRRDAQEAGCCPRQRFHRCVVLLLRYDAGVNPIPAKIGGLGENIGIGFFRSGIVVRTQGAGTAASTLLTESSDGGFPLPEP